MKVSELCDRYNIKSRKSLYSRLDALDITLAKDGNKAYATDEQVKLLDQQNQHLKSGGTLKNFVPEAQVTVHDTATQHSDNLDISSITEASQHTTQLNIQHTTQSETTQLIQALSQAIADKIQPTNPLWFLAELERARANNWELTTSQVKALIGVKPSCKSGKKTFRRGSFVFVKSGKIGNQTAWKVQKVTDGQDGYKV